MIIVEELDKKKHEKSKTKSSKNECHVNFLIDDNDTQNEIETMKKITKRIFIISNLSKLIKLRSTEKH